jgi:hypothetical protein
MQWLYGLRRQNAVTTDLDLVKQQLENIVSA